MPTVLCVYVKRLTELQYSNRILVVTSSLVNGFADGSDTDDDPTGTRKEMITEDDTATGEEF